MSKYVFLIEMETEEEVAALDVEGAVGGEILCEDLTVTPVDPGDILSKLPVIVEQYMIFDTGHFTIDFEAVFDLMGYVYDKPIVVVQTLLKLSGALRNVHQRYYDVYNQAKEEFDNYAADREAYLWSEAHEMKERKTKTSVEAYLKSDPTWQAKKQKVTEAERMKSVVYQARDLVEKAYSTCDAFVKNGQNVTLDRPETDRSFHQLSEKVIQATVEAEEMD